MSIIGAVSPAGGDFSEPITQHSLRLAGTFWALDTPLARERHFPAIDWNRSYTLYDLAGWFGREVAADWEEHRAWARDLLQREAQLLEIVQLLGTDTLAPPERVVLRTGRLLREDFLQQSAFDATTPTAIRTSSWRCCGRSGGPTRRCGPPSTAGRRPSRWPPHRRWPRSPGCASGRRRSRTRAPRA